jgi:hypothetical protein
MFFLTVGSTVFEVEVEVEVEYLIGLFFKIN